MRCGSLPRRFYSISFAVNCVESCILTVCMFVILSLFRKIFYLDGLVVLMKIDKVNNVNLNFIRHTMNSVLN